LGMLVLSSEHLLYLQQLRLLRV
jgi:hypothetical protein